MGSHSQLGYFLSTENWGCINLPSLAVPHCCCTGVPRPGQSGQARQGACLRSVHPPTRTCAPFPYQKSSEGLLIHPPMLVTERKAQTLREMREVGCPLQWSPQGTVVLEDSPSQRLHSSWQPLLFQGRGANLDSAFFLPGSVEAWFSSFARLEETVTSVESIRLLSWVS